MDADAWEKTHDPGTLIGHLDPQQYDRKLRLFAVACCRRKWKFFTDERCTQAVEIAEVFADDDASTYGTG